MQWGAMLVIYRENNRFGSSILQQRSQKVFRKSIFPQSITNMECIKMSMLSVMLLWTSFLASIDGFGVQPKASLSAVLSENNRRRSSLRYQNEESPTSSVTNNNHHHKKTRKTWDTDDDWDLREDWALQDSVPRYTVGTTETATFWTQLKHSTPELGKRTESELEERYKDWYKSSEDSLLVECGPSPRILSDWRVDSVHSSKSASAVTMMSGSLDDGSRIWFPLKCAGTVGDDPMRCYISPQTPVIAQDTLVDCFISASMTLHTSSYAESTAGIVYELGAPRCEAHRDHRAATTILDGGIHSIPSATAEHEGELEEDVLFSHLDRLSKTLVSVAGNNAGTILTTVVVSTLSACLTLGFVSGPIAAAPISPSASPPLVHEKQERGDIVAVGRSSQESPELTISEKRARAELRVGRDKRSLVLMEQRLEKDEANLEELRKEEYRLEAAEWGYR